MLALAQGKPVSPVVLQDYPDIVARIRQENEAILAKERTERERIKAIERVEENELNAELNKLPPPLKRHAETEIYSTLHLPETHKDYPNRFYIALGKVRSIAFAHLPGEKIQATPEPMMKKEVPASKIQSIQDIKQQVIQSIQMVKSIDELKQVLKGIGFLPLPGPDKRQLIDLYQNRFSELMGELKFGERISDEEKKKRRAPQKVSYATSRRLEEFGIKERYGYA